MSSSSDTSTPNVENMSNAELFQYLFKAELDAGDLPAALTEVLFEQDLSTETVFDTYSPSSSAASTVAHSPYTSASPTASSPHGGSPVASILSYDSPSPYRCVTSSPQQLNFEQEQEQQPAQQPEQQLEYQIQMFQPLQQYPELSITSTTSLTYPTRLPSNMFSYRQISPDMPPSMPSPSTPAGFADTSEDQFYSLTQEATARASSSTMSTEEMTLWLQRFQQVQRLQHPSTSDTQNHYGDAECSAPPSSPTIKNSSLSNLLSLKREKHTFYPSPPMKDDVDMDSDSDHGSNQNNDSQSDPLKPSPSELKKMTSKERRQLRNKLSARNFRVRRKEYISSLEVQVKEARKEAAELQKKLTQSELSYQFLKQELETLRLSQTLFNDGRMSKEHANLLASLLNPNTESFPTTSPSASHLLTAQQQQKELMDCINHNNMTILNNSLTNPHSQAAPSPSSNLSVSHGSLQPYVPFDDNWDLLVNRVEMEIDPVLDPKDIQPKEAEYHGLLVRYEAAKYEAKVDEQMRTELQAYQEQRLAQTYIVMPKDESMLSVSNKANQDTLLLQTMVYMMMIHLTQSMFQAATLSNTQLVDVYQTMDEPLRSKMGQEQQERPPCKFAEWREAWIRKCWPSFYNNRRRVCELLKNGLCPSAASATEVDVDETVRKMEEGVKDKTVEPQAGPFCLWLRNCIASWLRCPEHLARQEQECQRLLQNSEKPAELIA